MFWLMFFNALACALGIIMFAIHRPFDGVSFVYFFFFCIGAYNTGAWWGMERKFSKGGFLVRGKRNPKY